MMKIFPSSLGLGILYFFLITRRGVASAKNDKGNASYNWMKYSLQVCMEERSMVTFIGCLWQGDSVQDSHTISSNWYCDGTAIYPECGAGDFLLCSLLCIKWDNRQSFLGYYFPPVRSVQTTGDFLSLYRNNSSFSYENKIKKNDVIKPGYRYRDPIITTFLANGSGTSITQSLEFPGYGINHKCIKRNPILFQMNSEHQCLSTISRELCEDPDSLLSTRYYLKPNDPSIKAEKLGHESILPYVEYACLQDISQYIQSLKTPQQNTLREHLFMPKIKKTPEKLSSCGFPYQMPKSHFDAATQICRNTVLSAEYVITWDGKRIDGVHAKIILADVPLYNLNMGYNWRTKVWQTFKVKFKKKLQPQNEKQQLENPGYDFGAPIIGHSGRKNSIQLWLPGVDSLCQNAQTTNILFGYDSLSSCSILVNMTAINCDMMKKKILMNMNSLISSARIYIGSSSSESVPILRLSPEKNSTPSSKLDSPSLNIFSHKDFSTECLSMPSGIHLHVLYSNTGRINDKTVFSIRGASISYSTEDWSSDCKVSTSNCRKSNKMKSFTLKSSVSFNEIAASTLPVLSSWERANCREDPTSTLKGCKKWNDFNYLWSYATNNHNGPESPLATYLTILYLLLLILIFQMYRIISKVFI